MITDPEYHYEAVNVEVQQANPHSLLWWMKRLLDLRRRHRAFSRGSLQFLHPENRKVLAFLRRLEDETILVVANLSRFVQHTELDLSELEGRVPIEMFGRVEFPAISGAPYFLTLAPHSFLWFSLEAPVAGRRRRTRRHPDARPRSTARGSGRGRRRRAAGAGADPQPAEPALVPRQGAHDQGDQGHRRDRRARARMRGHGRDACRRLHRGRGRAVPPAAHDCDRRREAERMLAESPGHVLALLRGRDGTSDRGRARRRGARPGRS